MAIDDALTLARVGKTKKIERKYVEHFARELARIVRDEYDNNQTRAAKALGLSQAHISSLSNASSRGPGLSALLVMRDKTGQSIDELLGLPPPPQGALEMRMRASLDFEVARLRAEAARDRELAAKEREEAAQMKRDVRHILERIASASPEARAILRELDNGNGSAPKRRKRGA